jgi:hypothetical protein
MTYDEALAILGPELVARMNERLGPPAPLSEEQITLLVGILGDLPDEPSATAA